MLFNEFCECTSDLSTYTEIEMKKYTKRNILEQRKTGRQRQSHCRSIAAIKQIDRQKLRRREEKGRELADRSRFISRSIGRSSKEKQRQARELADRSC